MEWKYVKPLSNISSITEIENKYNMLIPQTLRNIIIKYNGGRPKKDYLTQKRIKKKL